MENFKKYQESKKELLKGVSKNPLTSGELMLYYLKNNKKVPKFISDVVISNPSQSWTIAIELLRHKKPVPEKLIHSIAKNWMMWGDFKSTLNKLGYKLPDRILKKIKVGTEQGLI